MCDVVAPLCRDKQIQLLELVLCQPEAKIPPLIFIHGLSGTGTNIKVLEVVITYDRKRYL